MIKITITKTPTATTQAKTITTVTNKYTLTHLA